MKQFEGRLAVKYDFIEEYIIKQPKKMYSFQIEYVLLIIYNIEIVFIVLS